MECPATLGQVLLLSLDKEQYLFLPDDDWYCLKVKVKTPEGDTIHFPCYTWVKERQVILIREGKCEFNVVLICLKMFYLRSFLISDLNETVTCRKAYIAYFHNLYFSDITD